MLFILPPELDAEAAGAATERVRSLVTAKGGDVHTLDFWGRRRLAYPIEKRREGAFHITRFSLSPEQTVELDRTLKLNDQVLRHMIVSID
ncbi:MAG: ribosomal protein [Chloroflexi bacterium]|nr:ribosomal protein [Chloroflexota bacterium]